jgi:hypothetical protein
MEKEEDQGEREEGIRKDIRCGDDYNQTTTYIHV